MNAKTYLSNLQHISLTKNCPESLTILAYTLYLLRIFFFKKIFTTIFKIFIFRTPPLTFSNPCMEKSKDSFCVSKFFPSVDIEKWETNSLCGKLMLPRDWLVIVIQSVSFMKNKLIYTFIKSLNCKKLYFLFCFLLKIRRKQLPL